MKLLFNWSLKGDACPKLQRQCLGRLLFGAVVLLALLLTTNLMLLSQMITLKHPQYGSTRIGDDMCDVQEIKGPVTHICFLKVHKAGSTTVQNMLYRFGLKRNLSFVLPSYRHYISMAKYYFSDLLPPFKQNRKCDDGKYDILCNHMVFNMNKTRQLLPSDTFYFAIIREPFDVFISAAYYYKFHFNFPYLAKLSDRSFISDLINNPEKHEATLMLESMTYNRMAYDFGLNFIKVDKGKAISNDSFAKFLSDIKQAFDLVLVMEQFDESLVLLKRRLRWKLEDIIYIKSNNFEYKDKVAKVQNITQKDLDLFKQRNKFDYGLYSMFSAQLQQQIAKEESFRDEVAHFQGIHKEVQDFCRNINHERKKNITCKSTVSSLTDNGSEHTSKDSTPGNWDISDNSYTPVNNCSTACKKSSLLTITTSKWNKEFQVTSEDCKLMFEDEPTLFERVKARHVWLSKIKGVSRL